MHIARGMYYGSYRSPRVLLWSIGVIILIVMMANLDWPNCNFDFLNLRHWFCYDNYLDIKYYPFENFISNMLPFNKSRTKSLDRIGPHNKNVLDLIICGMLGDFWAEKIPGKNSNSVRFNIEQGLVNSAYIHHLTLAFFNLGYCSRPVPTLVTKYHKQEENTYNYRLSLFTFSNLNWIYDSFYIKTDGINKKVLPLFIEEFISPAGLANWIMQDGSFHKGQGISIATNNFTYEECLFLANILHINYKLKTSVVKTGVIGQWSLSIWKRSMPLLIDIVSPYFIPEMEYKLKGSIKQSKFA